MLAKLLTRPSSSPADPLLELRLQLSAETLLSLRESNVTPVLAIGHSQCGKSAVLDSLLPGQREVFQSSQMDDISGVFTYSETVEIGDKHVLLMEMTGIDFKDPEPAKKLLYVIASVCSGVVVCLENTAMIKNLTQLLEVYQAVEGDGRTQGRCQFIVMVESQSILTSRLRADYENFMSGPFSQRVKFIARGVSGISATATEEIKREILQMSTISVADMREKLERLKYMSENCLTYRHFRGLTELHCGEIAKMKSELPGAQVLNLLVRTSRDITFNEAAFSMLAEKCGSAKEISLVVILGEPGLGKSTLLNQIVKYVLRLPSVPRLFTVGNTVTHTTLESQVLSMLLSLPGSEVKALLVDLEGLGGTETVRERVRKVQKYLIAAILAMASVPCLLVSNTLASLRFIEDKMRDIADYRKEYGLVVDRILLLFNDKSSAAGQNQDIVNTVERCKRDFGLMDVDVRIINKPSFVSKDAKDEIEPFLEGLVGNFDRPKRFTKAGIQSLVDILSKLREIINLKKELVDLEPTDEEWPIITRKVSEGTNLIEAIYTDLTCPNDQSLEATYKARTAGVLRTIEEEVSAETICVRRLVANDLMKAEQKHYPEIRAIEKLHDEIHYFSAEQLRSSRPLDLSPAEFVRNFVFTELVLCKIILFWLFWRHLNSLSDRIGRMSNRYINSQALTSQLRQSLSCALYSILMSQSLLVLGLLACVYFVVLGYYQEMLVVLVVLGLIVGVFGVCMGRNLGKWPNMQATSMIKFGKAGIRLIRNPFVDMRDSKVLLIVVVGPRRRGKSVFLNGIAASINSFAVDRYPFFADSKDMSCYQFSYVDEEKHVSRGVLVDISLKKMTSPEYWNFQQMTCSLLRKASKVYFYVPSAGLGLFQETRYDPRYYRELLIAYSQSRPLEGMNDLDITVLCTDFNGESKPEIEAAFKEYSCKCVIADFNPVSPAKEVFREFGWRLPSLRKQDKEDLKRVIDDCLLNAQN